MKKRVRIGVNRPHPLYVPLDLVDQGFVGDVDMYANAATITIAKPGVSLDEIERSLKIVLEDIQLRKQLKEKGREENDSGYNNE